jgi:hypothetical protein
LSFIGEIVFLVCVAIITAAVCDIAQHLKTIASAVKAGKAKS